ncbi:MAG: sulfurtransferase [Proteobacteria bacterium]|nr:sulfurtransferase [Pseudomonadota bacterium]
MRKLKNFLGSWLLVVLFFAFAQANDYSPVVSTDWLEKNLNNPNLVIIDIRKAEDYKANHIPNSINVVYSAWAIEKAGRKNELPENDDLQDLITNAGINDNSLVVIVGLSDNLTELVNMTRVAWTLNYSGFEKVSVLDGGFTKWSKEGKTVTTETKKPKAGNFKIKINQKIYADKNLVKNAIGKSVIVDTRMPEYFFGVAKLDFVARAGHIESAVNLPSGWIYTKDGNFKMLDELEAMAKGVLGSDKEKEIITYCDTGRLASGWWFVLSKMLGYKNVKMYDGSAQDWAGDATLPMVKYSWK